MRFQLKQIALAGLLTCLGASAMAANYFFVQPKSIDMSKTSPLSVALNPSALPDAVVGKPYNAGAGFDLKSVLAVSGDPGFNAALSSFAITSGTLPAGLTVSAAGVLSGTPTVASAGSSIQVTATYKTASGAQTYQVISLNLTVTLAPATLPPANVGVLYNGTGFDFKPSLAVTGDSAYTLGQATFKLANNSNALPNGLFIGSTGVLTGTPTATTAGASFTLEATYKTQTGQTAYTIVVGGAVLQVTAIASGWDHTCALTTAGGVKCWGEGSSGRLGDGLDKRSSSPVNVPGLASGVASISAGGATSCAITTTGAAKCWGYNTGAGATGASTYTPATPPGLSSGVTQIALSYFHGCAVVSGAAKCWGSNGNGEFGNGTSGQVSNVPVQVTGLTSGVTSVAAGTSGFSCAVANGAVKCWGNNGNRQLGSGFTGNSLVPVDVSGLTSGVARVYARGYRACAIKTTGDLLCWGNFNGAQDSVPTALPGLPQASSIDMGDTLPAHLCAVTPAGGLKCLGNNTNGQLGLGTTVRNDASFAQVPGLETGVTGVATGNGFTCATTSGGAKCWGLNTAGQLGDGTVIQRLSPVTVTP